MSRETYVLRMGKLILKQHASPRALNTNIMAMRDIAPFIAPDGSYISSRSQLRAYEQRTGTRQVGNDFRSDHEKLRQKVHGDKAEWFKRKPW